MKNKLIVVLLAISMMISGIACGKNDNHIAVEPFVLAEAEYPVRVKMPQYDDYKSYEEYDAEIRKWNAEHNELCSLMDEVSGSLKEFTRKSVMTMFNNKKDDNALYSPVNFYLALAMLAETSAGDTRDEILKAVSAADISGLRKDTEKIWKANYKDDGYNACLLANSIWLSDRYKYNQTTVDTLKNQYFASSYSGSMGSEEYNIVLRDWLNKQTRDLLKEQADKVEMDANTVFALASAIYYQGKWSEEFYESSTYEDKFYLNGRTDKAIDVDFMHKTYSNKDIYFGDKFMALAMPVEKNGTMWLVLPDEGISPAELSEDPQYLDFMTNGGYKLQFKNYEVNLSLPKFDITADNDMKEMMNNLGMVKVWNDADFSNLIAMEDIVLSKAQHAVRVTIDEKGVKAAAFTVLISDCTSIAPNAEKFNFNVNRPFLFHITSDNGTVLFSGLVNNPIE